MKKTLTTILIIALLLTTVFALTACKEETEVKIVKTEITLAKNAKFRVEDEFSTSQFVITTYLSDDTTKTPTAATLDFDTSSLKLDADNKFTEAGNYTLKVIYLDQILTIDFTVVAKY